MKHTNIFMIFIFLAMPIVCQTPPLAGPSVSDQVGPPLAGSTGQVVAPPVAEPGGEVGEAPVAGPGAEVTPPDLAGPGVVTDKFLTFLEAAKLSTTISLKVNYYRKAFDEIAGTSIAAGLEVNSTLKNSYPIVVFDTLEKLILQDLTERSQNVLALQRQGKDYGAALKACNDSLHIYDGYVKECANQFTVTGTAALQEYHDQRDPIVFRLHFEVLASFAAAISHPTKQDIATAKSYFDECDQLWGKQISQPPTWTLKLSIPGYGSGDKIRQGLYQLMASMYITYALDRINEIKDQKSIDDFSVVMQSNIALITEAQQNYQKAWDLYNTLATDYEASVGNKIGHFLATRDQYGRLINSLKSGIADFNAGNYQKAADDFASVLTGSKPILTNILTTKAQQQIGDAAVKVGQNTMSKFIATLPKQNSSAQVKAILDGTFGVAVASAVAQYSNAKTAYLFGSEATDVAAIQSYFTTLVSNLSLSIDVLQNLSSAASLEEKAETALAAATTISAVDAVDANFKQSIALASTADSNAAQLPKTPDYVQIYSALGEGWSFAKVYEQNAGRGFKQKADAIDPSTYANDETQKAFVYDLYLKAYSYEDALPVADQQVIEKKLQETDLFARAETLKVQAKEATDWSPQPGVEHYASVANDAWQNAITAYYAAYKISIATGTLFKGAYFRYQVALNDYAQAYHQNVPDEYFEAAGEAAIYYKAYIGVMAADDTPSMAAVENKLKSLIILFFDEIAKIQKNLQNDNYDIALYYYSQALKWRQACIDLNQMQEEDIAAQNEIESIPSGTKKLFTITDDQTGFTVTTDFGNFSASLGNVEEDFASWSAQQGDQFMGDGDKQIADAASSILKGPFKRESVQNAQKLFTNAKKAYQKAADIYTKLQSSTLSNTMTANAAQAGALIYACAQLSTVNAQLPTTFANVRAYGLYFLKPSFWQVPKELASVTITQYLEQYSLSADDQNKLFEIAAKYTLNAADWDQFAQLLNELQFPLSYPPKADTWQKMQSLFGKYSLAADEKKFITDKAAQYALPPDRLGEITGYMITLPAMLYLYLKLQEQGYTLEDFNLSYATVAQSFAQLKGQPTSPSELITLFGIQLAASATIVGALYDSYTYFHKTLILLGPGVKGVAGNLLLYGTPTGQLYLIENDKITTAVPAEVISQRNNWYPTPLSFYNAASQYFSGTAYTNIRNAIDRLTKEAWLSSGYQTSLKTDYLQGLFTDENLIDALSFSDEYISLQKIRGQIKALKALIDNQQNDPQALLRYSLSPQETQSMQIITYYYGLLMTGIESAGLPTADKNTASGDAELAFGRTLSNFITGDPDAPDVSSNLKTTVSQYQAARAFYTDGAKKNQVALELSAIFSRLGSLAVAKVLPMDPTQVVPKILINEQFSLHDYDTAATMYINGAAALQDVTTGVKQLQTAQINVLSAYYKKVVENFAAYVLLRNNQGTEFASLAQKYSDWYAQQQAIERQFVDITQDQIDLYQSIWNTLLDSLTSLSNVLGLAGSYAPKPTDDTIKNAVDAYIKQKNIAASITDEKQFNTLAWQDLESMLTTAFDDFTSPSALAAGYNQAVQKVSALANALFSNLQVRYIKDWEGPNVDKQSASQALTNLINAMSARESAKKTINYLG